ncbi:MAG: AbrB/MazE/SpoVT family DNA-binding domain-containing protein [candidate division NC10 bacterium]|nr:AbrB/MazE/SpoVT family DNA-binding domain-containing protein [candidate division NC10 bacterium]
MSGQTNKGMKKAIVRLSSKGQFTLPAEVRRKIGLRKGDYLKSYTVGDRLILLERVAAGPFEEIVERFSRLAAEKELDEKELATLIKKARRELNRELYGP